MGLRSCFIFLVSFETQEKQWSVHICTWRKVFSQNTSGSWISNWVCYPFNAALNWLHIHFLWQGTVKEISAHIWNNVIQEIFMHLPDHPSTKIAFFRKGPHLLSPIDCNGMAHMSKWSQSVQAVQKMAFYYHTSLVVPLRVSYLGKFSTVQQTSKLNLCIS